MLLVCALLLSACCSAAAADEPITIEVPIFEGGEGLDFFLQCAREYEQEKPGITVDLYGDPRIADKVRVRILEGSFPEITNAGINYWALIRNGDILPLDTFLDAPNWEGDRTWRESFLPGVLDRYTHEGRVYAVPLFYSVYAVWYNRGLFRERGWKTPRTWPEFLALCEQIKASGIPPLAFQGRYPGYAQAVIDSVFYHLAGADRYRAQKNLEPGTFDNPELIKALELVQKTALNYFQEGAMGMSHTEAQMQFFLGKTAMIFCGAWLKSEHLGKIPEGFELGCFNLPLPEGNRADPTAVFAGSNYYFVFAQSQHPREAVDFLRFMTSRKMAGLFCRQRDFPVAVVGANEGNLSSDMEEMLAIIRAARTAYGSEPGEGFPEMDQYWSDARTKILEGDLTPERAAKDLEEAARAVRNRAEHPDRLTYRHFWQPLLLLGLLGAAMLGSAGLALARLRAARRAGVRTDTGGLQRMGGWNALLFVGPAAVLYTVFVIVPCLKAFVWSLHRWDGLTDMTWAGLIYFKRLLFEDDGFWTALGNNLFLMFMVPLFVLPLSLFLATCISRGVWGSWFFRVVFFFPNILGGVAASLLWMHLYNPQGGVVNEVLAALGNGLTAAGLQGVGHYLQSFDGFAWLSPKHLYWALIPMSIWGACGFNMILFLAAMESIPQSIYEAADLDGASPWRQFWSLTLPLIWEVLSIAIVFMVIGGMKAFEVIWLLTNQRPTTESHVIGTRMVQSMFTEFKVGEATAIAVLLFLMVFFGSVVTLRLMRRETVEF